MQLKNITLKAHCNTCLQVVFKKSVLVNMALIKNETELEARLLKQFGTMKHCGNCGGSKAVKTYSWLTYKKLIDVAAPQDLEAIERAKAQIASTYDFNNDMSSTDRKIIREAFQKQLDELLTKNNISK